MTVRDLGAESTFDDPDDGWFGAERPAGATPSPPAQSTPRPVHPTHPRPGPEPLARAMPTDESTEDTDRWAVQDMQDMDAAQPAAPESWESRISTSGAWDFRPTSGRTGGRWYRSRTALAVAAMTAGVVAIVAVILLLHAFGRDESPPAAPSESAAPSAPSTSTTVPSALPSAVAPLPSPPPPPPVAPPPPPGQVDPPVVTRRYTPNYPTPGESKKPQTNVTRSPMSATPPPPPRETNRGRATPGESGSHGFFG